MRDEFDRFIGMFVLVTFDIKENSEPNKMSKRLRELTKVLKGFGQRVQYSVFECYLDNPQIEILKKRVGAVVNPILGDNVRFYKMCNSCQDKVDVIGEFGVTEDEDVYIF